MLVNEKELLNILSDRFNKVGYIEITIDNNYVSFLSFFEASTLAIRNCIMELGNELKRNETYLKELLTEKLSFNFKFVKNNKEKTYSISVNITNEQYEELENVNVDVFEQISEVVWNELWYFVLDSIVE